VAKRLYRNQEELVKGIADGIRTFHYRYFQRIYQRLLWQLIYVFNG